KSRILAENRALQLLQLLAGLDPELLDEHGSAALVHREGICLASAAVQREHELGTDVLSVGMCSDEHLERRDDVRVPAELELGIVELRTRNQLELLEPRDLLLGEQLEAEIGERRPAEERERAPQDLGAFACLQRTCLVDEPLEP